MDAPATGIVAWGVSFCVLGIERSKPRTHIICLRGERPPRGHAGSPRSGRTLRPSSPGSFWDVPEVIDGVAFELAQIRRDSDGGAIPPEDGQQPARLCLDHGLLSTCCFIDVI